MGTVAIIGIGLIGGSYGLAIRALGLARRVVGCARRQATLNAALELGAADAVTSSVSEACREADLVILAAPVEAIVEHLARVSEAAPAEAVVTDAGSVKRIIVDAAQERLRCPERFVGGHPMAGSERVGVEHASADLFRGATYLLTPVERTAPEALSTVRGLAEALGARVLVMSPDEHDQAVAAASHVPHLAAAALVRAVAEARGAREVHGAGLSDTTRVAAGDPVMWRQILLANAGAIENPLRALADEIATVSGALAKRDADAVEEWLRRAAQLRLGLDPDGGGV